MAQTNVCSFEVRFASIFSLLARALPKRSIFFVRRKRFLTAEKSNRHFDRNLVRTMFVHFLDGKLLTGSRTSTTPPILTHIDLHETPTIEIFSLPTTQINSEDKEKIEQISK